jgi:hypothetical protein
MTTRFVVQLTRVETLTYELPGMPSSDDALRRIEWGEVKPVGPDDDAVEDFMLLAVQPVGGVSAHVVAPHEADELARDVIRHLS